MPRKARIDAAGALHHIICRGIEERRIFRDDADRDNFVKRLSTVVSETATSCLAWALMPNHFHLLLRTGNAPITTVMRRLLTGYAVSFNIRHERSGPLFRNRFKSILCQKEPYFLELVRYIHLNPLRAMLVPGLDELDLYPYSGHSRLMGRSEDSWQDIASVLGIFGKLKSAAQRKYRQFVENGIPLGKQPELTGGGVIRSAGGWEALKPLFQKRVHVKGDERILGDSNFVDSVLNEAKEKMERRYRLKALGYDFKRVVERAAEVFDMPADEILSPGKQPARVRARSVAAYWAVRELGLEGTEIGRRLGLSQSAVSRAVGRGERFVLEQKLSLQK